MTSPWKFGSGFDIRLLFGSAKQAALFALSDESEPSINIEKRWESKAVLFRAKGLPHAVLLDLSQAAPTDLRFVDRFAVAEIGERDRRCPIKGNYYVEGTSLVFVPDQPLLAGGRYLATLFLPDPLTNRDVGSLFSLQSEFALRPADILAA